MAPQALLSRGNTGERAAAAVCCARGAPAAPEQQDTWGGSFMTSPCFPECGISLGALGHGKMWVCSFHLPQPRYFSVFRTEPRTLIWCVCLQHCSSRADSLVPLSLPGRVLKALSEAGVPVPPVLALCEDRR